ncbi:MULTISPECIES: hypothetical protein [unclassified Streptomyces]|uniref:hypothetical protein n=1 Tax=unclassified Streptomyces TaxID=2593676 RepID=UPI003667E7FC
MAGRLSHLVTADSGLSITVPHADLDEASFPLRRQVVNDVLALRDARMYLWYEKDTHSLETVDGVFGGLMDRTDRGVPFRAGTEPTATPSKGRPSYGEALP